jgi:hypothetical protein
MSIQNIASNYIPKELLKFVVKKGDFSFRRLIDRDLLEKYLPPLPEQGLKYDLGTAIALKASQSVAPHTDPDLCGFEEGWAHYGTVFGLLKCNVNCDLQVANAAAIITPGSWVLFNDKLMHSLVVERNRAWCGVAVQVMRSK